MPAASKPVARPWPEAEAAEQPWIELVGLGSALWFALVSYGRREQLGAIGYLAMSQLSLVFLALAATESLSVRGGLLLWAGETIAITGLLCVAAMVDSRRGTVSLNRHHGLAMAAPLLSLGAFVFGVLTVGLPGSLTFIAEDVIAQGLLVPHPALAAGFVLVTALNAIGFLRIWTRVFAGSEPDTCPDLLPRERVGLGALALVGVLMSFAPQVVMHAEDSIVPVVEGASDGIATVAPRPLQRRSPRKSSRPSLARRSEIASLPPGRASP